MPNLGIPADYGRLRGIPLQPEATVLVSLGLNPDGREIRVAPETALAWRQLRDAAAVAGVTLVAISGFRSVARQAELIQAKLTRGDPLETILSVMAAPGYSEHHTGRAIDIAVPGEPPLTEEFTLTPAFAWLQAHAASFGFRLSYPRDNPYGIAYEPWHWFHLGTATPPVQATLGF
jgi:zinc D-Ala-D-Ala carboxypeptidase